MTTKELIDYVEGELKKGEQKDAIKARLLQNGWSSEDVEETFGVVSKNEAVGASNISLSAHNKKSSSKVTDFVAGFFLGLFFGPAILFFILFKIFLYLGWDAIGEFGGFGTAMISIPLSFIIFAGSTAYFLIKKRRYFVYGWIFSFLFFPVFQMFKPFFVNLIS